MAIVPLKKVTLYGPAAQRDEVLDGLQRLGCLHLVPLRDGDTALGKLSSAAYAALRFLEDCPDQRPPTRHRAGYDFAKVDAEVLQIQERQRELTEEQDELAAVIDQLRPWGDFQLPSPKELKGLQFWFYVLPHHERKRLTQLP